MFIRTVLYFGLVIVNTIKCLFGYFFFLSVTPYYLTNLCFNRLNVSKRTPHKSFVDWTSAATMHVDAMTSDVIAPSPWKIFGCQNGKYLIRYLLLRWFT